MRLSAGASTEDRNKMIAIGAFVAIAAAVVYFEYFRDSGPSTPAPVAVSAPASSAASSGAGVAAGAGEGAGAGAGTAAKTVGTTSAGLDPTLHMEAMLVSESVEYSGSGRNIFSAQSAPPLVVIPKPIAPARLSQAPVGPVAPIMPQGPPPPPKIDLKFFGTETANGKQLAFLLHNDDVIAASAGDVVLRRYKAISIEAKTIHVQDMQYNDTQTLPLLTN